jgi:HlyD family secretion protein
VQPGEPVLVLGDLDSIEVEVDVLSPDAVRLRTGMAVELERWGGDGILPGRVRRVEPAGFTKISALGIEEQRVWVFVDIDAERERWRRLGDGFRVEARFVLSDESDILQAPAAALFREGERWGAYVIADGRAHYRAVTPGRRSGLSVEIVDGLTAGERVLLHPGQDIVDGTRVSARTTPGR